MYVNYVLIYICFFVFSKCVLFLVLILCCYQLLLLLLIKSSFILFFLSVAMKGDSNELSWDEFFSPHIAMTAPLNNYLSGINHTEVFLFLWVLRESQTLHIFSSVVECPAPPHLLIRYRLSRGGLLLWFFSLCTSVHLRHRCQSRADKPSGHTPVTDSSLLMEWKSKSN